MNLAIIGAGVMGAIHAASCQHLPEATASWIVDADLSRATAVAAAVNARPTVNLADALDDPGVEAVVVAVPTPYHRPLVEAAATAGKHILCEKPIARTVADAQAMVDTCRQHGVRLMVGQVVRFFPEYRRIGELLAEGAIGQVGVVRASRLNAYPSTTRPWFASVEASGGPVLDAMIHDLDTLRWYFGEVERVFARSLTFTPHQPTVDYALAIVRMTNGVIAHLESSWAHTSFRTAIEIAGSEGILRHASDETTTLRLERTVPSEGMVVPAAPLTETPYQAELRHFLARVADGQPSPIDGEEGTRTLALTLAVLESARVKQPIPFADGWPLLEDQ